MKVISCILLEHNLPLVLLAAFVCVVGCGITLHLFSQALKRSGRQQKGWIFLSAVAGGSSIWCTHFIAMLAYQSNAPVSFDPMLTMGSLLLAIGGTAVGLYLSVSHKSLPEIGGMVVGMAIAVMHFAGMAAYHIDGIVTWDVTYIVASIALSLIFSAIAIGHAVRAPFKYSYGIALAVLVVAVVCLHFTAMTAMSVEALLSMNPMMYSQVLSSMAVAVAGVAFIIVSTGIASHLIDADASSESISKLLHLARNDALTGLPNRMFFNEYLQSRIDASIVDGSKFAVIGIDLDRFKEINDVGGHEAGDRALKIIAMRLSEISKSGEFVARLGGDEFAAIKSFSSHEALVEYVGRLEAALFAPIQLEHHEAAAGASIGVAIYPADGETAERLVNNADLAMYRAKADLMRAICFYEPKMDEAARARRSMAQDLRKATDLGQFELYYQVQSLIATGEISGYEVLLRWHHPERGLVPPIEFIPVAEETGSILEIGEWVLRTACAEAATWDQPHKIAVNISPVQFAHTNLAQLVHQVLIDTGLPPKRLELEITESTIIADKARALHTLRQIRALGVAVAIDDFGTGYSSIDTLRSFPFDKIKLDRSFMKEAEHGKQARAIIRAMLTLGKSLEIRVLAEGVETIEQLDLLRREGCDEAQGYFLGRPAPVLQALNRSRSANEPETIRLAG